MKRRKAPTAPPRYVVELSAGNGWLTGAPLRHRSLALAIMAAEMRRRPHRYGPTGPARLRVRRIGGKP